MKSDRLLKHSAIAFAGALLCYAVAYYAIEYRRTRKGPWEVTFTNNTAGIATLLVNQHQLGITNAAICFEGQTVTASTNIVEGSGQKPMSAAPTNYFGGGRIHRYDRPYPVPFAVPFGECLFMDTTFLPGTITFKLFEHEVELLPRVLIVDYQEHAWQSGATLSVPPARESAKKPAHPQ